MPENKTRKPTVANIADVGAASEVSSVAAVAERALVYVASQNARAPAPLNDTFLKQLHEASIGRVSETCADVADAMIAAGVRHEDIVDRYIPSVARRLGEEWSDDDLSFSLVSIGSARLQALIRRLGPDWSADTAINPLVTDAAALVIVTAEVHHTLGSMVLAGQLRRAGLSVRLSVGATADQVVDMVRNGEFEAVLISASVAETLKSLKQVVDAIRSAIVPPPPIVIGGSVLDQVADVQALTGADLTTIDVREALEFCNLMSRAASKAAFLGAE